MAMIQCDECGKDISSLSQTCVGCGAPVPAQNLSEWWQRSMKPAPKTEGLFLRTLNFFTFLFLLTIGGCLLLVANSTPKH